MFFTTKVKLIPHIFWNLEKYVPKRGTYLLSKNCILFKSWLTRFLFSDIWKFQRPLYSSPNLKSNKSLEGVLKKRNVSVLKTTFQKVHLGRKGTPRLHAFFIFADPSLSPDCPPSPSGAPAYTRCYQAYKRCSRIIFGPPEQMRWTPAL